MAKCISVVPERDQKLVNQRALETGLAALRGE